MADPWIMDSFRLALEQVLDMLAAGNDSATILSRFPSLKPADIRP